MSILESLLSPILNFLLKLAGRRMPITKEQIEPYERFRNELTRLYRAFRIARGLSPNVDKQAFKERIEHLRNTNGIFYGELTYARSILDESHVKIFDDLIGAVYLYLDFLRQLESLEIEQERIIRKSHLNDIEEQLDIMFIEAEYTVRRFLLGFSLKSWRKMKKLKSRHK